MKQYVSKSIHGKHIQEGLHMGQESIYRKAYIWFLLVTSQHALVWKLWPIILDMRLWKLYIFILPIKAIAYLSDYLFFSRVKQLSCIKLILMFLNQGFKHEMRVQFMLIFSICVMRYGFHVSFHIQQFHRYILRIGAVSHQYSI